METRTCYIAEIFHQGKIVKIVVLTTFCLSSYLFGVVSKRDIIRTMSGLGPTNSPEICPEDEYLWMEYEDVIELTLLLHWISRFPNFG